MSFTKKNYKSKFDEDIEYGLNKEDESLELLEKKFGKLKKLERYSVFDFENDYCIIELKSRKCGLNKYPTTMIGKNKIDKALTSKKDVFFCFNFDEGLYYWKFSTDLMGKITFSRGGRKDRGKQEFKEYCFIPIEMLQPFII